MTIALPALDTLMITRKSGGYVPKVQTVLYHVVIKERCDPLSLLSHGQHLTTLHRPNIFYGPETPFPSASHQRDSTPPSLLLTFVDGDQETAVGRQGQCGDVGLALHRHRLWPAPGKGDPISPSVDHRASQRWSAYVKEQQQPSSAWCWFIVDIRRVQHILWRFTFPRANWVSTILV